MQTLQTRRIPIHNSLLRPQLLLGGERKLVVINGLVAVAIGVGVGTLYSAISAIVVCGIIQIFLQKLAKADASMFDLFRRNQRYQSYYAAHSMPDPIFKQINK